MYEDTTYITVKNCQLPRPGIGEKLNTSCVMHHIVKNMQ